MKQDEQQIAIAAACGWKYIRAEVDWLPNELTGHFTKPHPTDPEKEKFYCTRHSIPDYLNDLNAMHQALAYLEPDQIDQFAAELTAIVLENDTKAWWDLNMNEVGHVINATAAQHAEAFLRTLNLWTDDK